MAHIFAGFMDGRMLILLLYLLAFGTSVVAFAQKSMIMLRALIVVSSTSYVLYYFLYPPLPMWPDIITETVAVMVNLVMLVVLIRQERGGGFSEEEKDLYSAFFGNFSAFEFIKLIRSARWETLEEGSELAVQDVHQETLYFIYDGMVEVWQDGTRVNTLFSGYFIGEISFTLGKPANATVRLGAPSRLLAWNQEDLKNFLQRNPSLKSKFDAMISTDLAQKLTPGSKNRGEG